MVQNSEVNQYISQTYEENYSVEVNGVQFQIFTHVKGSNYDKIVTDLT